MGRGRWSPGDLRVSERVMMKWFNVLGCAERMGLFVVPVTQRV